MNNKPGMKYMFMVFYTFFDIYHHLLQYLFDKSFASFPGRIFIAAFTAYILNRWLWDRFKKRT